LIDSALATIHRFDFVDVLESPAMHKRLMGSLRRAYGQRFLRWLERLIFARRETSRHDSVV
jgi:hypothetical protein